MSNRNSVLWITLLLTIITQQVFSRPQTYTYTYKANPKNWNGGRVDKSVESGTQGKGGIDVVTGEKTSKGEIYDSVTESVGLNDTLVLDLVKTIKTRKIPIAETSLTEQIKSQLDQMISQLGRDEVMNLIKWIKETNQLSK